MTEDPNYRVDGIPPAIKGKITELEGTVAARHRLRGAHKSERDAADSDVDVARYNLMATIKTYLKRAADQHG